MSTTGTPKARGGRLVVIDGLRLLVALAVASYHYFGTMASKQAWGASPKDLFGGLHEAASYGWLGVEMFFLISGFVICMSSWGRTTGAFFRSRVTRLFPAYWPAVLLTSVVLLAVPDPFPGPDWHRVLVNLAMLNQPLNVAPIEFVYWTLWAEARFYLLFAVVLLWRGGLSRQRATWFGFGWLAVGLASTWSGDKLLLAVFQPEYAPYFVAGMALYLIHRFGPRVDSWSLFGASYVLMTISVTQRTLTNRNPIEGLLKPAVSIGLITVFCAVLAAVALGWTSRVQWKWLTTAGALTYPFYLIHLSIGWVILHALRDVHPHVLVAVLVMVLMLVTAWLIHKLVERPLARVLKNALTKASSEIRDAPPPAPPIPAQRQPGTQSRLAVARAK